MQYNTIPYHTIHIKRERKRVPGGPRADMVKVLCSCVLCICIERERERKREREETESL